MEPRAEWVGRKQVRAQVLGPEDLKAAIEFQNDVNALLAAVSDLDAPAQRMQSGIQAVFGILQSKL